MLRECLSPVSAKALVLPTIQHSAMTHLLGARSGAEFTMVPSVPMLLWLWRLVPITTPCLSQAPAAASALKTMPLSPTTRTQEQSYGLGDMMAPLTIQTK